MTDVLLIEDDPLLREATQLSLELHGYGVRTASGGHAGPALLICSCLHRCASRIGS